MADVTPEFMSQFLGPEIPCGVRAMGEEFDAYTDSCIVRMDTSLLPSHASKCKMQTARLLLSGIVSIRFEGKIL